MLKKAELKTNRDKDWWPPTVKACSEYSSQSSWDLDHIPTGRFVSHKSSGTTCFYRIYACQYTTHSTTSVNAIKVKGVKQTAQGNYPSAVVAMTRKSKEQTSNILKPYLLDGIRWQGLFSDSCDLFQIFCLYSPRKLKIQENNCKAFPAFQWF